jgi:hypothetical protein
MDKEIARALFIFAAVFFIAGVAVSVSGKVPWLGRLPGDILIKKRHVTLYFPLATSLVISLVLTLLFFFSKR